MKHKKKGVALLALVAFMTVIGGGPASAATYWIGGSWKCQVGSQPQSIAGSTATQVTHRHFNGALGSMAVRYNPSPGSNFSSQYISRFVNATNGVTMSVEAASFSSTPYGRCIYLG
jgi:hypothetical protein